MPPPLNHHRRQRVPTQVLALVVVLPAPLVRRVPLQPPLRHRHCCHHLPLRQWLALRPALPALRHRHCCLGGSRHLPLRQWLALSRQRLALQPQHRRQRLGGLPPHR